MDAIIPDIDKIMSSLEQFLRGGQSKIQNNEIQDILHLSNKVYHFFFNIVSNGNEYNSNQKNNFLELAVKLHNKARNLTSQNLVEIRTIIKASCAWMFIIFGEKNSKILSTIIKLLTKCGEEFHLNHKNSVSANECYNSVCILWSNSNDIPIYNDLPPMELQEIKLAVFRSLIGRINIELNNDEKSFEIKKIKQNFTSILSLVSGLHIRYRLLIIDRMLKVGHKCADCKENLKDSLHFITIALDLLDSVRVEELMNCNEDIEVNSKVVEEFKEQIIEYKIKSFLMLVYIYSETDELVKALASIGAIEKIEAENFKNSACSSKIDILSHSILFAKLTVALKENNKDKIDLIVKSLLKNPRTPFQTSLSAVKKVIDTNNETEKERVSELFKLLVNKYPNDPEFTMIRISHLQATISSMKLEEKEDEFQGQRARDIAIRILSDHLDKTHELNTEDFHLFRNIITEQLRWYESLSLWKLVKIWSDLLIDLTESNENSQDFAIGGYILKIESLLKLKEYAEALVISNKIVAKNVSTKTISIYFKTLLFNEDMEEELIVKKILSLQTNSINTNVKNDSSNSSTSYLLYNTEDKLKQLIICCYIAQQSELISQRKKDFITINLLRAWIELYCENEVWKNQSKTANDSKLENDSIDCNTRTEKFIETNLADLEENKLLDIVKDYIIFYMKHLQDLYSEISLCIISNNESNSMLTKSSLSKLETEDKKFIKKDIENNFIDKEKSLNEFLPTQAQDSYDKPNSQENSHEDIKSENTEEAIVSIDRNNSIEDVKEEIESNDTSDEKEIKEEEKMIIEDKSKENFNEEGSQEPPYKILKQDPDEILLLKNKTIRENFKLNLIKISQIIHKLRQDIIPILFLIRHYLSKDDNFNVQLFGTNNNYEWISKISNFLGCFLLDLNESNLKMIEKNLLKKDEKVNEDNNINNLNFFKSLYTKSLLLSSEFFILSEFFLSNCEYSIEFQVKDRVRLLLTASASLLDSLEVNSNCKEDNFLDSQDSSNETPPVDESTAIKKLTNNLLFHSSNFLLKPKELIKKAKEICEKAQKLQYKIMDFADQEDKLLHNTSTILLLTCFSKDGDINNSEDFIQKNSADIKLLSTFDLKNSIDLISSSRNFSIEAMRLLLDLSINTSLSKIQKERVLVMDSSSILSIQSIPPSLLSIYESLGWMYRNLIELAPSRKAAYDRVLDFETIIKDTYNFFNIENSLSSLSSTPASPQPSVSKSTLSSIQIFNKEDIDQILALSYNYAVTLIDLDQLQLAELFMKRAMSLLTYSSEMSKEWKPRLQETCSYINTLKNENSNTNNSKLLENNENLEPNQEQKDYKNKNEKFSSNIDTDYGKIGHISLVNFKN